MEWGELSVPNTDDCLTSVRERREAWEVEMVLRPPALGKRRKSNRESAPQSEQARPWHASSPGLSHTFSSMKDKSAAVRRESVVYNVYMPYMYKCQLPLPRYHTTLSLFHVLTFEIGASALGMLLDERPCAAISVSSAEEFAPEFETNCFICCACELCSSSSVPL